MNGVLRENCDLAFLSSFAGRLVRILLKRDDKKLKESLLQRLFSRPRRRIFVSYRRRGDGAGYAGRLADSLIKHFGSDQCYLDIEHVEPGLDFVLSIKKGIEDCEVLIVVIGPDWVTQTDDADNPRLEDSNDWVRIEVATALKRNIRVIPVLVGGAQIPTQEQLPEDLKSLSRRQGHELSDTRWQHDVQMLMEGIEKSGIKGGQSNRQTAIRRRLKVGAAALLAGGLVFTSIFVGEYIPWRERYDSNPAKGLSKKTDQETPQTSADRFEHSTPEPRQELHREPVAKEPLQQREEKIPEPRQALDKIPVAKEPLQQEEVKILAPSPRSPPKTDSLRTTRPEPRPRAEPIMNIGGVWRDSNYPSNGSQITQEGNSFYFKRWGVLPDGTPFESSGSGTITARRFTSYYNARYQFGATSAGDCSGSVSPDGMRMEVNCRDSLLGIFTTTAIRQ